MSTNTPERTMRNRTIGWIAAFIVGILVWTLVGIGVASMAKAATLPDLACSTTGQTQGTAAYDDPPVVVHEAYDEPGAHHDAVPGHWWNWSPNKDQGPFDGPPSFPTDDRGTWTEHDNGGPGQDQVGTFLQGEGNASWFHRAQGVAAYDDPPIHHDAVTTPGQHHDAVAGNPGTETCETWVSWLTPNYVPVNPSWNSVGQPQIFLGFGQLAPTACEQTIQHDLYRGTRAAINSVLADDLLTGGPEDSSVVKEWNFVSSETCPEVVTYEPTCSAVTGTDTIVGTGVISVAGDWDSNSIPVPFSGTLADIGTVLNINATPLQYVGLHIHTAEGTIVFEEEGSYAGNLWSNVAWDGVSAGMGYPAFGSIEDFIELNGDVVVTGVDLLYTHPEASSTKVTSFTIGCTTYTFVPPVTPVPVVFNADVNPPTCDEDGSLPNLEQFMQETEEFSAANISIYFDRAYDGPGEYLLTVDALNGYTFPDGSVTKFRTLTVDPATGVTQSENPEGACYLAPEPTPTPTESTPVPTPSTTTPVVTEVTNAVPAAAPSGELAHTGTDGLQTALLTMLVFLLAGVAFVVIGRIRKDRSQQI